MIDKIRVSLWDIFSFLLTGLLAITVALIFTIALGHATYQELLSALKAVPAALLLSVGPLVCILIGMLVEPIANNVDKLLLRHLDSFLWKRKDSDESEEDTLKEEIRSKYLGGLNNRIDTPFQICKEYVETKELSTTFMVYLSRYGFYRNCTFLAISSGVASIFFGTGVPAIASFGGCILMAVVTKRRQLDFYSYMAPAVYRAFLIDKLEWAPRSSNAQPIATPRANKTGSRPRAAKDEPAQGADSDDVIAFPRPE